MSQTSIRPANGWPTSFTNAGLSVELIPTEGHPMVLAETPAVDGAPVVVVYGHYDVQPVEPLGSMDHRPV